MGNEDLPLRVFCAYTAVNEPFKCLGRQMPLIAAFEFVTSANRRAKKQTWDPLKGYGSLA